jgi:hypothetical protein
MGVKVRLSGRDASERIWTIFDIRGLPGAAAWLRDGIGESPRHILDLDSADNYAYQVLQTDQAQAFVEAPRRPYVPPTKEEAINVGFETVEEYERYIVHDLSEQAGSGVALEHPRSGTSEHNPSKRDTLERPRLGRSTANT